MTREDPIAQPGLARSAIRIRATDQLNGVIDQLNAVVFSILPDWDAGLGAWVTRGTRNPASIYRALLQGGGTARPVPDSQIDLAQLQRWHGFCAERGFTYDAVIDYQTSRGALLREVAAAGRASPSRPDGKRSVIIDEPKTLPVQHFTPRNSWGFTGEKAFPERPHAWRARFINEDIGYREDERIVYADGFSEANATKFEVLEFPGVVDPDAIFQHARYYRANLELRPETYSFFADLEHIVCTRGDLIRATHDVPLWGSGWGRLRAVLGGGDQRITEADDDRITQGGLARILEGDATGVELDEPVIMEADKSYALRIRRRDGASLLAPVDTDPGLEGVLSVTFNPPVAGNAAPSPGDLWMFGELGRASVELIVKAIEPRPRDHSARLVCVDAAPAIHDSGAIPPFNSVTTVPLGRQVPVPTSIRSDETVLQRGLDGSLRPRILVSLFNDGSRPIHQIDAVEARYRIAGSAAAWSYATAAADAVEISLTEVEQGDTYEIAVRYRHVDRTPGLWSGTQQHTVVGSSKPPPDVSSVWFEHARLYWAYEPPLDHRGFRVRLNPGINTNWAQAQRAHGGVLTDQSLDLSAVAPGTWTGLVKAVDLFGNESAAAATAVFNLQTPVTLNVQVSEDLDAGGFPGTITGGAVAMGQLEADDASTYLPNGSALYLPVGGDPYLPGEYEEMVWEIDFDLPADAQAGDLIKIDHTIAGDWKIEYTPADELATIGWRPWPGALDCAQILGDLDESLLLKVTTAGGPVQGIVTNFDVLFDPPDIVERQAGVSIGGGGTRLTLTNTFRSIAVVNATIRGTGQATARVVDKDESLGPLIEIYDFAGAQVAGTVDVIIQGY
jgi:hypothetical protein